jgi:hypothetical protein
MSILNIFPLSFQPDVWLFLVAFVMILATFTATLLIAMPLTIFISLLFFFLFMRLLQS